MATASMSDTLTVNLGTTRIRVLTAKRPGQAWHHREVVETARRSYQSLWGNVPTLDAYDRLESTFNYVAYVYDLAGGEAGEPVEALTLRLVTEAPEDVSFYHIDGVPLERVLAERLPGGGSRPPAVAGHSRIGSIRPAGARSNGHTLAAFVSMQLQLVADARSVGVDYMACQLRPELSTRVLTRHGITYQFPRTESLLELPPGAVRLNRDDPVVREHLFNFPGYFLDSDGVCAAIRRMLASGELPPARLRACIGREDPDQLSRPALLKALVPLITADDSTGAALRAALVSAVPDGTYSSVSHVDDLERQARDILRALATASLEVDATPVGAR